MLGLSGTSSYAVLVYFVFVYLYFLYLTHRNIIFNILEQFSKITHMLGLSGTSSYAVFVYLYFLYLRADMMQNHICWHLFACSPLCVNKCTLKLPTWSNANSHWLHLSDFWDCLPGQLYIHNDCTCLLFLHYEFLNVSSDFLLEQMQNHNGCICLTFLHCVLTNVFWDCLPGQLCFTMIHLFDFSPLWVFKCFLRFSAWANSKTYWVHLFGFSPLCTNKRFLRLPPWAVVYSQWLHLFDFCPLWVFKCFLRFSAWANAKSHWLHLFDFSPLSTNKCFLPTIGGLYIRCSLH